MSLTKKIEWYMGDFSKNSELNEICFEKPIQTENEKEDVSFSMKMKWCSYNLKSVNVYLLSSETVTIRFKLDCDVSSSSTNQVGRSIVSIDKKEYVTYKCNTWTRLFTFDMSAYNKTSFELKFYYDIKKEEDQSNMLDSKKKIGSNYMTLLRGAEFSDIVIVKSIEGNEHKVHKAMLASRCEVLKAHFEHNMTESKTNIVETPLENEVLMGVLTFIYCDVAPNIKDVPGKLLAAADFYQLNELKSLCEEELQKQLCAENALEILQLADMHSAEILKQFTLKFIEYEKKLILKSAAWAKMDSISAIKAILEYIALDGDIKCVKPSIASTQ